MLQRRSATIATFALSYAVTCASSERLTGKKTGINHAAACTVAGLCGGVALGRLIQGGLLGAGLGLITTPVYWFFTVHRDFPSLLQSSTFLWGKLGSSDAMQGVGTTTPAQGHIDSSTATANEYFMNEKSPFLPVKGDLISPDDKVTGQS
jgi:hypothetical protein